MTAPLDKMKTAKHRGFKRGCQGGTTPIDTIGVRFIFFILSTSDLSSLTNDGCR